MDEELLKKLGLSVARGVPQMATGFVDLAGMPFTALGLLEPEEVVGSTAYLTQMGLLPPPQEGVIPETLEMVSGAMSPGGAGKELLSGLLGVTAYHGSPYLFKQFDPARIGTGEGAQAFGAGAGYTAEAKKVAEGYRGSVPKFDIPDGTPLKGIATLIAAKGDEGEKLARKTYSELGEQLDPIIRQAKEIVNTQSYLYKGDIPDEIVPSFLNWDQPIKNQDAFSKIKDHPEIVAYAQRTGKDVGEIKGRDAYELIASGFDVGQQEAYPLATQYLDNLGVRGVRYLDQQSRPAGVEMRKVNVDGKEMYEVNRGWKDPNNVQFFNTKKEADDYINQFQTSNFVVFRPEDYQIQEINDIPLEEYIRKGLLD